jgi:hypothetical protein
VPSVRCEKVFFIPEDGILHGHRRVNIKIYLELTGSAL